MKRSAMNFFDKTCQLTLTICSITFITLVLAVPAAQAQEVDKQQPVKNDNFLDILERQKSAIVGSWLVNVKTPGFPDLKVLLTFTEDGNVIGTAQGDVSVTATTARALSVAQGAWKHQGGRTFASSFLQISYFINTGELRGFLKFRMTHELDSAGDEWSGPYKFDFVSPTGTLFFSSGGTTQAQRIKVELIP